MDAGRINGDVYDDIYDVVNDYKRRRQLGNQKPPPHTPRNYSKVKVKNVTGGDLRRGEIVEFTDFLLTELEQDYLWFEGSTPDLTKVGWGITLKPIPSTEIDEVLCLGVCIAYVNFTDDNHKFARRVAGSNVLKSDDRGSVKILQDSGGVSERECVVHILDDTPMWYLGITRSKFTQGIDSYFQIDVYVWNDASVKFTKVPGFVIRAVDWFLNNGEVVEKDTKVCVDWYINEWVVTGMYCSATDDPAVTTASPQSPGELEAAIATLAAEYSASSKNVGPPHLHDY